MKLICSLLLLLFAVPSWGQSVANAPRNQYIDPEIINNWYCPDAVKVFPPINIKLWKKTPVVNGRLPTLAETENGMSLLYINKKLNPKLKDATAYKLVLPKLAYIMNPTTHKSEIVVVVQMVQFTNYVWVGYRFLTGGVGSCTMNQCRFLTADEVKKVVG